MKDRHWVLLGVALALAIMVLYTAHDLGASIPLALGAAGVSALLTVVLGWQRFLQ